MHTEMWEHAATRANVATLRERGVIVVEPAVGRLTGADSGKGRLPDPGAIFALATAVLDRGKASPADLRGVRVHVSAGGTREFLDPVRFLGNRSSGRQGIAIAEAAASRGAAVTLVAANVSIAVPAGVDLVRVETTAQLREEILSGGDTDAVVMAAAPSDFRPADVAASKIKKSADGTMPRLDLVENPDILRDLVRARTGARPLLIGFAAETGDATASVIEHARSKLARKGCDYLVVNDVSGGRVFGSDDNDAVILGSDGTVVEVGFGPKIALAHAICDVVAQRVDRS